MENSNSQTLVTTQEQLPTTEGTTPVQQDVKPISLAELPPEELAKFYNQLFDNHYAAFIEHVDHLSGNEAKRLCKALTQYPLNAKDYKPRTEVGKNAFLHAAKCFDSKFALTLYSMQLSQEEALKQAENNKTNEQEKEKENDTKME